MYYNLDVLSYGLSNVGVAIIPSDGVRLQEETGCPKWQIPVNLQVNDHSS